MSFCGAMESQWEVYSSPVRSGLGSNLIEQGRGYHLASKGERKTGGRRIRETNEGESMKLMPHVQKLASGCK